MDNDSSSKYDIYYEIARNKYREAWDRNKQVQKKASGGLGIAGIIAAFAINVSSNIELTWWWLIPGVFFLASLTSGVLVLLPKTWRYDPSALSFGAEIDEMSDDEAKREAANSYAEAAECNNKKVTQKAEFLIVEFLSLAGAVVALVFLLTFGS